MFLVCLILSVHNRLSQKMDFQSFWCGNRRVLLPIDVMPEGATYMVLVHPLVAPTESAPQVAGSLILLSPSMDVPATSLNVSGPLHQYCGLEVATSGLAQIDGQRVRAVFPSPQITTPILEFPSFSVPSSLSLPITGPSDSLFPASFPQFSQIGVPPVVTLAPSPPAASSTSQSLYSSVPNTLNTSFLHPTSVPMATISPSLVTSTVTPSELLPPSGTPVPILDADHNVVGHIQPQNYSITPRGPFLSTFTPVSVPSSSSSRPLSTPFHSGAARSRPYSVSPQRPSRSGRGPSRRSSASTQSPSSPTATDASSRVGRGPRRPQGKPVDPAYLQRVSESDSSNPPA